MKLSEKNNENQKRNFQLRLSHPILSHPQAFSYHSLVLVFDSSSYQMVNVEVDSVPVQE